MFSTKFHWFLWLVSLIIHIVLLVSTLHMFPNGSYYKDMKQPIELRHEGIGKRAVIFLIAGLNITLFYSTLHNAQLVKLNAAMTETGSWGLSWSNQGNTNENIITLISGVELHEIPWFNKRVNQPDLLTSNMRRVTYIGAPIINFIKQLDNWEIHTYPKEWSNYTKQYDDAKLDRWISLRTKNILNNKVIYNNEMFILYFEGLKIINKYDGKNSPKARTAAKRIFTLIDDLINAFDNKYNDNGTVYILTSDFVRNDIKEYIDDTISEFPFPVLAWGAGINGQPTKTTLWTLKSRDRRDIEFKDIAPLIACVLGLPTPAHSTGSIPFSYLKNNLSFRARCALSNIKQLYCLCVDECKKINENASIELSRILNPIDLNPIPNKYRNFETNIDNQQYHVVVTCAEELLIHLKVSIEYYKTYYPRMIKIIISIIYLGWIIYLSSFIFTKPLIQINTVAETNNNAQNQTNQQNIKQTNNINTGNKFWKRLIAPVIILKTLLHFLYIALSIVFIIIAVLADSPVSVIIYLTVLFIIILGVFHYVHRWNLCRVSVIKASDAITGVKFCMYTISFILLCAFPLETVIYTAALLLTVTSLPYTDFRKVKNCYISDWMFSSLFLMFFMSYGNDYRTTIIGIVIQIVILISIIFLLSVFLKIKLIDFPFVILSLFSVILATITNCLISEYIINNTLWMWILVAPILFVIFIGSNTLCIRLLQIGIALIIPYILTAKSYEPLTYFCIYIHLCTWFIVETYNDYKLYETVPIFHEISASTEKKYRKLQWCDARRAFMCALYILSSYIALNNEKNVLEIIMKLQLDDISSFPPVITYIFRLNTLILTVSLFYQLIGKYTKACSKSMLLCILLLFDLQGFLELTFAIIGNTFQTDLNTITYYLFTQVVIISYLLMYPLTVWIISPSLMSSLYPCVRPQRQSDISMTSLNH